MLPLVISCFTLVVVLIAAASIGAVWTNLSRLWTEIHVIKSSRQKYQDGLAKQLLEFQEAVQPILDALEEEDGELDQLTQEALNRFETIEQKLQALEAGAGLASEEFKRSLSGIFARRDFSNQLSERIGKLEQWKEDILGELMGRIEQAAKLAKEREERVRHLCERVGTLEDDQVNPAWANKIQEEVTALQRDVRTDLGIIVDRVIDIEKSVDAFAEALRTAWACLPAPKTPVVDPKIWQKHVERMLKEMS